MKNRNLPTCIKCGKEFKPEIHRIFHCEECFKANLKKIAKMPLDKFMNLTAKSIGL